MTNTQPTVNDRVTGYIRTLVPYGVGAVLAWLLTLTGLDLTGDFATGLAVFLVVVVTNLYYFAFRLVEVRFPWVGIFLGIPKTPDYTAVDNLWASFVRTAIPTLVSAVVSTFIAVWLNLDATTQTGLIAILVAVVSAVYYGAARAIVARWPKAVVLLGSDATPVYPAVTAGP